MAEFLGDRRMKRAAYDRLTRRQRSWIIVGMVTALAFQTGFCYVSGLMLHRLGHLF
jgi:hypothetical protein